MTNNKILDIKSILLAFILGLLISKGFEINDNLTISLIISGLYLFFIYLLNKNKNDTIKVQQNKTNDNQKENKNNNSKHKEKEMFSSRNSSFWTKNTAINKSPFEGLFPEQLANRLNYLFYATSHPFKPKNYTDYVYSNKNTTPKSIKHL